MKRPKSDRPLTVETASSWISYYNSCIDVLQNHCEILCDDSYETAAFKLYARIQKIQDTYNELKLLYPTIPFKSSSELTKFLKKGTIPDKQLEEFVKYLVASAGSYTQKRG